MSSTILQYLSTIAHNSKKKKANLKYLLYIGPHIHNIYLYGIYVDKQQQLWLFI